MTEHSAQPTPIPFGQWGSAIIRPRRRSPWQNGHVERLIGSIRRESLDHLVVFDEAQLRRVLKNYASCYNQVRTHLSLDNAPDFRRPQTLGPVANISLLQVVTTGDGMLATFQAPTKAIRCAAAIREAVRTLGLEIRAGLHAGEYKPIGDEVVGIAIHIGARVAAKAGASEVLVSSAVKDLVPGSGIRFKNRGFHNLKGVPDRWRLYLVDS